MSFGYVPFRLEDVCAHVWELNPACACVMPRGHDGEHVYGVASTIEPLPPGAVDNTPQVREVPLATLRRIAALLESVGHGCAEDECYMCAKCPTCEQYLCAPDCELAALRGEIEGWIK